jgi:hypothetical protein
VHLGYETSTHYFSCFGGPDAVSTKSAPRTRYAKLVFLHLVRSAGHIVHSGASGARNINALFFMLRWARYRSHRKRVGTRYVELVCFASYASCLSHSAFWCVWGAKHRCTIFHARLGLVWIRQKVRLDMLY